MKKWAAEKYADALVSVGVNLQKGETLFLLSDIAAADLAREVAQKAMDRGAKDVEILWTDAMTEAIRAKSCDSGTLRHMPEWKMEGTDSVLRNGTGVHITISCSFPSLREGIPDENLLAQSLANNDLRNVVRKYIHRSVLKWTGTVYPTMDWARQVYPECDDVKALELLEDAVCKMMRVDETSDPVENWRAHCAMLSDRSHKLNSFNFRSLHITSELGTDLTIGLVKDHIWVSAGEMGSSNVNAPYVANMPTEEVFTDPDFRTVNGIAYASFPLYINGKLVKDFSITFENGKAVDCSASEGVEFLRDALFCNEFTRQLGEVALVSKQSPIRKMGRIFYNGLLDENAACHLAFGSSFSDCVKGGASMTEEELYAIGVNHADSHHDFMIGTDDLKIVGTTYDGREITVMEHGDFVI